MTRSSVLALACVLLVWSMPGSALVLETSLTTEAETFTLCREDMVSCLEALRHRDGPGTAAAPGQVQVLRSFCDESGCREAPVALTRDERKIAYLMLARMRFILGAYGMTTPGPLLTKGFDLLSMHRLGGTVIIRTSNSTSGPKDFPLIAALNTLETTPLADGVNVNAISAPEPGTLFLLGGGLLLGLYLRRRLVA